MRIKAIILDFDGTLFNTWQNGLKSTKDLFREVNRPFRKHDEKLLRNMWGEHLHKIIAALFPEAESRHREYLYLWIGYSHKREKKAPSRLIPGTNATLKILKDMGLTVAIATNRSVNTLYEALLATKAEIKSIDYILGGNPPKAFTAFIAGCKAKPIIQGTPHKKPDPRYLVLLKRFLSKRGIMPHETIFCGDAPTDAETAREGGYGFIPVLTGPTGTTNAWWEAWLTQAGIPKLAIASSVRDLPLLIRTLEQRQEDPTAG